MSIFSVIQDIAERKICESERNGAFSNLQGKGKPLVLEDDSMVPPDLRMAYKVLRNSGHLPKELEEEQEINRAIDLLADCEDEQQRLRQMEKLNLMITRINLGRKNPISLSAESDYWERVVERVEVSRKKQK